MASERLRCVKRLSQHFNPALPEDKSAKGAQGSRNTATWSIVSLKAYDYSPEIVVTSSPTNFDAHRGEGAAGAAESGGRKANYVSR